MKRMLRLLFAPSAERNTAMPWDGKPSTAKPDHQCVWLPVPDDFRTGVCLRGTGRATELRKSKPVIVAAGLIWILVPGVPPA